MGQRTRLPPMRLVGLTAVFLTTLMSGAVATAELSGPLTPRVIGAGTPARVLAGALEH